MPGTIGALTIIAMMTMVVIRVLLLKRKGIQAMQFGKLDKTDFLIPPFALFYFYTIFAAAFGWPLFTSRRFHQSETTAWVGVLLCIAGLVLVLCSIVSFQRSFRVGIDTEHPDKLITTGAFALSRNPIYTAFAAILFGEFLIFPNWVTLLAMVAGAWLFHRQVLREEEFLKQHYGEEYEEYARKVRRYL